VRRAIARGGKHRRFRYTPAPRVKITEIHHHPEDRDLEFVEMKNIEKRSVDLSGWNLPLVDYAFPDGSEAPAEAVFVVARSPARFQAKHGTLPGVQVFGPTKRLLPTGGGELRLRDGGRCDGKSYFPETIDVVRYGASPPWPPAPDGAGRSLEVRALSLDNDLPSSWRASREPGGSPGRVEEATRP